MPYAIMPSCLPLASRSSLWGVCCGSARRLLHRQEPVVPPKFVAACIRARMGRCLSWERVGAAPGQWLRQLCPALWLPVRRPCVGRCLPWVCEGPASSLSGPHGR